MDVQKIRNKIITISGEPVTGKGTTVKALLNKLKEKGYKEEDIHVITTGHEFRNYFNAIIECISNPKFISNINNEEELKKLELNREIKNILDDSEYKTKFIIEVENLKNKMQDPECRTKLIERLRRQYKASKKLPGSTLTIEEANNMPELDGIREIVDNIIDSNIEKKGEEINKQHRPDEVWIIDSRLAFKNIPDSFSVRLTCRPDIAGKRLFEDKSRGKEDSGYESIEAAIEERRKRKDGEIIRYFKRYQVDLTNEENYKLIIDTSYSSINDIADTILTCLDRYNSDKKFGKYWTSPITLVGSQTLQETCRASYSGALVNEDGTVFAQFPNLDDWKKYFLQNPYKSDSILYVNEIDGIKYLSSNGHHRNFGMIAAGKTLVPYEIVQGKPEGTRFGIWNGVQDHQDIIRCYTKNENFNYSDIYPDIEKTSKELDKKEPEK